MKKKNRKTHTILFRLNDEQIKWVKEWAKAEGKTVSAFLRWLVLNHKKDIILDTEKLIIEKHKKLIEKFKDLGENG